MKWILAATAVVIALSLDSCATVGGLSGSKPQTPVEAAPLAKQRTDKSALRRAVLVEAENHLGVLYKSPPSTPRNFDCSGFVNYVFSKAAGVTLPMASPAYRTIGKEIDFKDAQPGDLLVFASRPGGSTINHVAILYRKSRTGELRGSWLIHAVSIPTKTSTIKGNPNSESVVISEMGRRGDGDWRNEYFLARYVRARRVLNE
ncbi:MAG: C40 family peptidase [Treponema sp.]|jgi:cell wall-associated NlpC family hydrolase|nr:C40 family peptidase [Treponema sp.]